MAYDAFISYSHAADGRLAPAVQSGLQRLARPWNKVRALRVFRDDTGLAVNPHLWASIAQAMDESEWFVLLASPEAAASPWVNREVEHWLARKPPERILPVLTEGTLVWDPVRGDYELAASSALPRALAGYYSNEPRHLDLRWARDAAQLDIRHVGFREAIADLAAPMHGVPKDELESEDVRRHRRAVRLTRVGILGLVTLLLAAALASAFAVANAGRAAAEAGLRDNAVREQRAAVPARDRALTLQQQADAARGTAVSSQAEADRQRSAAEANAADAGAQRARAESAAADALAARDRAVVLQRAADTARVRAQVANTEALVQRDLANAESLRANNLAVQARFQADRAQVFAFSAQNAAQTAAQQAAAFAAERAKLCALIPTAEQVPECQSTTQ